jgi:hypothetical protein
MFQMSILFSLDHDYTFAISHINGFQATKLLSIGALSDPTRMSVVDSFDLKPPLAGTAPSPFQTVPEVLACVAPNQPLNR